MTLAISKALITVLLLAGCAVGQDCPNLLKKQIAATNRGTSGMLACVDSLNSCTDSLTDAIAEIRRRPFSERFRFCLETKGVEPCIHIGKPGNCFRIKPNETLEPAECSKTEGKP